MGVRPLIRATVSFKRPDGVSEGWLIDLPSQPRIGEEFVLMSHEGEHLERGRVRDVRHLAFGDKREFRAGAMQLEIDVDV